MNVFSSLNLKAPIELSLIKSIPYLEAFDLLTSPGKSTKAQRDETFSQVIFKRIRIRTRKTEYNDTICYTFKQIQQKFPSFMFIIPITGNTTICTNTLTCFHYSSLVFLLTKNLSIYKLFTHIGPMTENFRFPKLIAFKSAQTESVVYY